MNLKQLRDGAQALLDQGTDPKTPVQVEGCDCFGDSLGVQVWKQQNHPDIVMVTRTDGCFTGT